MQKGGSEALMPAFTLPGGVDMEISYEEWMEAQQVQANPHTVMPIHTTNTRPKEGSSNAKPKKEISTDSPSDEERHVLAWGNSSPSLSSLHQLQEEQEKGSQVFAKKKHLESMTVKKKDTISKDW